MTQNPITWEGIDAWANRTRNDPRKWELDAIRGIDNAYLASTAPDKPSKETKK